MNQATTSQPTAAAIRGFIDTHGRGSFLADLRAVLGKTPERASSQFKALMRVDSNQSGGFLIPIDTLQAHHPRTGQFGIARAYADVREMRTGQNVLPIVAPARTYWSMRQASAITIPTSNFSLVAASVDLQPIAITTTCTRELWEDSDWLSVTMRELDDAAQELEDRMMFSRAGISGLTGAGLVELLGTAGHAASRATAGTGETSIAALTAASFAAAVAKVPARAFPSARWFMNPALASQILALADPVSATGDRAVGLPFQVDNGTWHVCGLPVTWSASMPSTGTASSIVAIVGDLKRACALATIGALETAVSFDNPDITKLSQIMARGIHRLDIAYQDTGTATDAGSMIALQLAAT